MAGLERSLENIPPVPGAPAKKKIDGPEDLRAQIARDIAIARRFFTRLRRYRAIRQHV
jgi:hypothetical protein